MLSGRKSFLALCCYILIRTKGKLSLVIEGEDDDVALPFQLEFAPKVFLYGLMGGCKDSAPRVDL